MHRFSQFLQHAVVGMGSLWGGVGLLVIAFFDSSFLSFPEVNDLLIIYFCTRFKERAYYFAFMAMIGSVAGCTVLYWLGKWKGKPYLDRKYSRSKLESILRVYQRYGMFALIVPALLPPPFPFKVFVLTAGICGLSFPRFLIALAAGRGFRYFFEATIAIRYGDRALAYLEQNYMQVAFVLIAVIVVCLGAYLLMNHVWKRGRSAPEQPIAVPDPD